MPVERSAGAIIYREKSQTKKTKQKSKKKNELKKQKTEREYLLLLYAGGHWGFIKGNTEKKEKEKQTVMREAKEETGITNLKIINGFREKENYFYKKEGKIIYKEVIFLLGKTRKKKIIISYEHKDYQWANLKKGIDLLKFKNQKELLLKADKFLEGREKKINKGYEKR